MLNLLMMLAGALLYRWRGMAHPKKHWFPRPFNQIVFAAPYALVTAFFYFPLIGIFCWFPAAIVWILATLGALTGHGGGHDLGTWKGARDDERLEFLILRWRCRIPAYWYDALLLSVTGLAITLPAGMATLNPVLALSGALKGPAYMAARFGRAGTEGGELLTGAVLWGAIF